MALFLLANELQSYRIAAVPATRLLRARDTGLRCRCQLPRGAVILLAKHRGMLFSLTSIFTIICRRVRTRSGEEHVARGTSGGGHRQRPWDWAGDGAAACRRGGRGGGRLANGDGSRRRRGGDREARRAGGGACRRCLPRS